MFRREFPEDLSYLVLDECLLENMVSKISFDKIQAGDAQSGDQEINAAFRSEI